MARVTVIGGGVVGLTCALELARAGSRVHCVRDLAVHQTVSAVAGGLWFPYHVDPRDRVLRWGRAALERFVQLSRDPASGVTLREGLHVQRGIIDRWWTQALPTWREAGADELPEAAVGGVVATVPLVTMRVFLPWLESRCADAGVELERGRVDDLSDVAGDIVVVAAGLGSGRLLGVPRAVAPSRGQVALLTNPGLEQWYVDEAHPEGLVYVLPHRDHVVCGGTDTAGSSDIRPDPAVQAAIVDRCREAVPALARADVIGSRVGLRPIAPAVSLERIAVDGRPVVTNYGHGGAGVTLSWGCAADVVDLVAAG